MYCSKCQKYGKKGDLYCEDCGSKLERKWMPMKISKKTVNVIVVFFIAVFILLGFYGIGTRLNSPSYIAKKYLQAISENDIDKIYDFFHCEDDLFLSKEVLKDKIEKIDIEDYQIVSVNQQGNYANVYFQYLDGNDPQYVTVVLKKKGTNFLLFDNWEIEGSKVAKNVVFQVLKDSTLTIDGKDVSKYKVNSSDQYYDTYKIPAMITGKYQFKVTLTNGLTMDKEFEVETHGTYNFRYLELSDDMKSNLGDNAVLTLNQLYSAAIKNQTYKSIKNQFKISLENLYDIIKSNVNNNNIQSLKFSDPSIKSAFLNGEGNLEIFLTVDYSIKTKDGDNSSHGESFTIEYEYMDSTFVIKNIDNWRGR